MKKSIAVGILLLGCLLAAIMAIRAPRSGPAGLEPGRARGTPDDAPSPGESAGNGAGTITSEGHRARDGAASATKRADRLAIEAAARDAIHDRSEDAIGLLEQLAVRATDPADRIYALTLLVSCCEDAYRSEQGMAYARRALDEIALLDAGDQRRHAYHAHLAANLAWALLGKGERAEARRILEAAVRDYPTSHGDSNGGITQARLQWARLLREEGRAAEALQVHEQIMVSSGSSLVHHGEFGVLREVATSNKTYTEPIERALVDAWPSIPRHDLENSYLLGDATYRAMAGLGRLGDGYQVLIDVISRYDASLGADTASWPEDRRRELVSLCSSMQGAHNLGHPDVTLYACQRLRDVFRGQPDKLANIEAFEREALRAMRASPP